MGKDDKLIGDGWHQCAGEGHAEVNAINAAGNKAHGADCYVTLEPCSHFGRTPPCANLLIDSGIKHVIIAMQDPNPVVSGNGIQRLRDAGLEVTIGVLQAQSEALNPGFCKRMRTGMPYVRTKIAMSVDGRTAMESGESKWITGPDARQDVQQLRARSSAILSGMGTVLADDPAFTVRPEGDWYPAGQTIRQPLRVILSQHGAIPEHYQLSNTDNVVLFTTPTNTKQQSVDTVIVAENNGNLDLTEVMRQLAKRGMNEVMVEAGAVLNGALLTAGLIDEIIIYMAPKLMGNSAKGVFHMPELQTMAQNIELTISDIRAVGNDWRITAQPQRG
jgi:diaminohydroxyphosphoribosylaminopyrimidine deaminase/5-amino-6-(5-phosphoribosylamino)uracil reductase